MPFSCYRFRAPACGCVGDTHFMTTPLLVFGDDGSAGADSAWEWLTSRRWTGWRARIVIADFPEPWGRMDLQTTSDRTHARSAPHADFVELVTDVVLADPRLAISQAKADLVVIGGHGQGILKALHVGSTASWLMQVPHQPLIIARSSPRSRRILVCVDGSPHATAAVRLMMTMPWTQESEVTVVGVEDRHQDLGDAVSESARSLRSAGYAVVEHVIHADSPTDVVSVRARLLQTIERLHPELVVMGTQGRTGLARVWVGSVASGIAHRAPCSVLLARHAS